VLVLLGLMRFGFRKLEAAVITLVGTVAACYVLNLFLCRPDWGAAGIGLIRPTLPGHDALYISLGILGATVMPHNLYLHSALVQTRAHDRSREGVAQAIRYNTLDTVLALGGAFFVNAAILVLAAAAFHTRGHQVTELEDGYRLLTHVLGGGAATAFAIALLASGQSSTITGTLAGQIVMEGFLHVRVAPWLRRMITRGLALIPAMAMVTATGGRDTIGLLVLSQVVLSMQLSFAIFPLVMFTSDRRRMGEFVNPSWLKVLGYASCIFIAGLNLYLLGQTTWEHLHGQGIVLLAATILAMAVFSLWVAYVWKERRPPAEPLTKAPAPG
jgi:manganese transport protein